MDAAPHTVALFAHLTSLVLTLDGLQAGLLGRRMAQRSTTALTPRLLAWGAATGLVSQACWWGAVLIGFRNSRH